MSDSNLPRRSFLKLAAVGAVGLRLGDAGSKDADPRLVGVKLPPRTFEHSNVKLGVASYSLRNFARAQAIEMTKALGVRYINFKSVHLPYEAPASELAAARQEAEAAGLVIVGGGTITFETDTDDGVRKYFDYAKAAGLPLIVCTCKRATLPRIERFAKQYDIKIAIHNHGPEDENFPSPYDALRAVKGMDPRMGLCIDLGHTARTGTDVVRAIADAGPRLLDMHAKDLRDLRVAESQCIVGEGKMPIPEIFRQLQKSGYKGYVNLEYEIDPDNPMPGMKQSVAYMRGVLAALAVQRS
ncbi:MAG: sugar phosphate isomerase/epimerase family protein [Gemmatimonadaceae bacterium]